MHSETQRQIRRDHPALAGHFPGNPVVPGVVLLTELLGILEEESGMECGPLTLSSVKFMRLLRPEESFTLRWQFLPGQDITFAVTREKDMIATGTIRCGCFTKQVAS